MKQTKKNWGLLILLSGSFLLGSVSLAETSSTNENKEINTKQSAQNLMKPNVIVESLVTKGTDYLQTLMVKQQERENFLKDLYKNYQLENLAKTKGLLDDPQVLSALAEFRKKIILDAMVENEFVKDPLDLEAMAKENYELNKEKYVSRKKIKLAVIYINKEKWPNGKAKERIESVAESLKNIKHEDNPNAFHELAKGFSDDKLASKGGINKRWFLQPLDMVNASELHKVAFAMEKPNEISRIIESKDGYHILKLLAVTPSRQLEFKTVQKDIENGIKATFWKERQVKVISELKTFKPSVADGEWLNGLVKEVYDKREKDTMPDKKQETKK